MSVKVLEPVTVVVPSLESNLTRAFRLALGVMVAERAAQWHELDVDGLERVVLSDGQRRALGVLESAGWLRLLRVTPRVLPAICQSCDELIWSRAAADVRKTCEMTLGCAGEVVRVAPPTRKSLGL